MQPRIETLGELKLIGNKLKMSFVRNRTQELWQTFMPRRREIINATGPEWYSVEVYPDISFLKNFNPANEFEKWAGVSVSDFDAVPPGMETLVIPEGEYAVFHYKGKPSEAQATYQHIYGAWLPASEFALDDRPHFALMGEKYKGESPDSEEEFWIPIRRKQS